jgi:hypothetical protein
MAPGRARRRVHILTGLGLTVIAALAPGAAAAQAAVRATGSTGAVKPGAYAGTTSESSPVSFTVAANHASVTSFKALLAYNGKCGQGGGPGFEVTVAKTAISKSGTFVATATATAGKAKGVISISGTLSGGSAHGTLSEHKPFFVCPAPNQKVNPYFETFTAKVG